MRTFLPVDYHYSVQGDTDNCSQADESLQSMKGASAPLMGEAVGPQEWDSHPLSVEPCSHPNAHPSVSSQAALPATGSCIPSMFSCKNPNQSSPFACRQSTQLGDELGPPQGVREGTPWFTVATLLLALFFNQVTREGGCSSK